MVKHSLQSNTSNAKVYYPWVFWSRIILVGELGCHLCRYWFFLLIYFEPVGVRFKLYQSLETFLLFFCFHSKLCPYPGPSFEEMFSTRLYLWLSSLGYFCFLLVIDVIHCPLEESESWHVLRHSFHSAQQSRVFSSACVSSDTMMM